MPSSARSSPNVHALRIHGRDVEARASPRDGRAVAGTPLSRAGLYAPKSYQGPLTSLGSPASFVIPHTQDDIRANTMQLSSVVVAHMPPTRPIDAQVNGHDPSDTLVFPHAPSQASLASSMSAVRAPTPSSHATSDQRRSHSPSLSSLELDADLSASLRAPDPPQRAISGVTTPRTPRPQSNLTLLLARHNSASRSRSRSRSRSGSRTRTQTQMTTPVMDNVLVTPRGVPPSLGPVLDAPPALKSPPVPRSPSPSPSSPRTPAEDTPLLPPRPPPAPHPHMPTGPEPHLPNGTENGNPASYGVIPPATEGKKRRPMSLVREHVAHGAVEAVKAVPAVILGTLLNILDGVSYGMIIFPAAGVFEGLGAMGVTMFFLSALISQVVYSAGASGFAGANGSMMIEVVPFFHILANSIEDQVGDSDPEAVIATTLVAFALSSVLTGLTFLALGAFRSGNLIGFFPRHILVGCIGGVGVFLFITGLTVSTRLSDDTPLDFEFLRILFLDTKNLALWAPALALAVLLRVITARWNGQLILPAYFIVIPIVFYIVVLAARLNLGMLRDEGWLFDVASSSEAWWKFYTYFNFSKMHWGAIWRTLPTQLALLFFNILHPPLNVPALSVSLDQDVDTNKELIAHGYSNLFSGLLGTVPNYLVYVNTLLFYRVGGTTRISGFMLAGATVILLLVGTGPIAYIPVMVVGALIFVLGIDLMKEALWDTRHRVNKWEYITIVSIMVAMTVWDFVIGVLFGIIVSCFFFVVQNSQRRSIRAVHSGTTLMSTVRRPSLHREYIREVSKQTTVMRLQGFLFFGTIAHVEDTIRTLVDAPCVHMRFLIVDFALVAGVDMSSAEAFVRVQRLLAARGIVLVVCGVRSADVRRALENVELFAMSGVELFETMNDAMEWTENAYLRAWFMSAKAETSKPVALPGRQDSVDLLNGSIATSPRHSQLRDAGQRTIARNTVLADSYTYHDAAEPFNTLFQAFSSSGPLDRDLFRPLPSYLEHLTLPEGFVLWRQNDSADGLYIIEAGVLRATYTFAEPTPAIEESMVPGTLAGELSALAGAQRNATVVVERQAVLWKLSAENLRRLHAEQPELARTFTTLVLKAAKVDYDILLSALATRL